MKKTLYRLMLRSFDSQLSDTDRSHLDKEISSSNELHRMKEDVMQLRKTLRSFSQVSFSPFFTERVLSRLHEQKESVVELFRLVFRPVAVAAVVLIIMFSSYNIGRANSFSLNAALGIQKPSLEQKLALEVPFE